MAVWVGVVYLLGVNLVKRSVYAPPSSLLLFGQTLSTTQEHLSLPSFGIRALHGAWLAEDIPIVFGTQDYPNMFNIPFTVVT